MAIVKPFAALRPDLALAARICELPYDVLSSEEARALAADNPLSFLHVSKPEIDLDPHIGLYDDRVYAQGRSSFLALIAQRHLLREAERRFYLYRQVMGSHTQLGLVALTSCEEYLQNRIRKHEFTRVEKEDDRVRHIESLNAQTGPAFLVYPAQAALEDCLARCTAAAPDVDFVAKDEVRHSSWTIQDPATQQWIEELFASFPALYIADGHHRTAAAARLHRKHPQAVAKAYFLSVLFPSNQVQILAYHRVLKDLNGLSGEALLRKLEEIFIVSSSGLAQPTRPHQVGLYLAGTWHTLEFRPELASTRDPLGRLDVSLLQKHVLAPLFGVDDPRTSQRINFVGGIRGTKELERLVDGGAYACAFSLFPTQIEDLMAIAEMGGIMPPKSTWFEPKLRDGMFSYVMD